MAAPASGYLTRADYIEILKAAKARQIEVIPSFDMPGHSRAAILAMKARARRLIAEGKPEEAARYRLDEPDDKTVYSSIQHYNDNTLNVCLPSTYAFIGTVIDSLKAMHQEAGLPLRIYHIGADETAGAWKDLPACHAFMAAQHLTLAAARQCLSGARRRDSARQGDRTRRLERRHRAPWIRRRCRPRCSPTAGAGCSVAASPMPIAKPTRAGMW